MWGKIKLLWLNPQPSYCGMYYLADIEALAIAALEPPVTCHRVIFHLIVVPVRCILQVSRQPHVTVTQETLLVLWTDNIPRLRWAGHVARMEEGRSAFKILTSTPTGKRALGRPRRRWEDNIRMDFKEIVSIRGTGLIQLRIEIIGEFWHWTYGLYKLWIYYYYNNNNNNNNNASSWHYM